MIGNFLDEIKQAVRTIVALAQPEAIYIFGSRARGDHLEDSDWDLFVVLNDDIKPGEMTTTRIRESLNGLGIAFDVHAARKSVFERKRHEVNSMSRDVAKEGVLLYARLG